MSLFRQGTSDHSSPPSAKLVVTIPATDEAGTALRKALCALEPFVGAKRRDLELLVTELATNGVKHAAAIGSNRITLDASVEPHLLRVEVRDRGERFSPTPREQRSEPGGFGLVLVDRIADRWGVIREPSTTVWFELARGTAA
jgi:anti-sigma regulatory factor (Ser/Thr protein kinase)